jgi:hypothetical protein
MYVIMCTSLQLTFVSMWSMQLIIKVCKEDTGYSMVGGVGGGFSRTSFCVGARRNEGKQFALLKLIRMPL